MENASKALIMAGAVLLGILLLALMVYFFSVASGLRSSYTQNINNTRINEFNTKFTKYSISSNDYHESNERNYVTIHDIVSLANYAREYNANHDNNSEYHISISFDKKGDITTTKDISEYNGYLKEYMDKKFYCSNIEFNDIDGRVKSMTFSTINK